MKTNPLGIFLFLQVLLAGGIVTAQYPNHTLPEYPAEWNSGWITHPDIDETAHNEILFRQVFTLEERPDTFIIHLSADNRYRLFVNGKQVVFGPQLADIRHWRYETINLAPFLKTGENVIAASVMNWGVDRSYGIISNRTAFLCQGNSGKETFLNTGWEGNWKVFHNHSVYEKPVDWIFGGQIVGGFYAGNPTDSIVGEKYPWGWQELGFEDSGWVKPEVVFSRPKTNAGAGHGWIMQPRTTAIQRLEEEGMGKVIRSNDPSFRTGQEFSGFQVDRNSHVSLLIDRGYVTLGYPKIKISGGRNAIIRIRYSEALYDEENKKGNRNSYEGKIIKGISDVYLMEGGENRIFQPMWFRAYRFTELDITTFEDPVTIHDFHNEKSISPIAATAVFESDNEVLKEIWNICAHSLDICAQDNLLSDAYYEQMQYVGDLRPHLKAWCSLTGDLTFFNSAMEQFNNSRLPDGNITSCYPLKATFVHPSYSLIWIDMLHDLMMLEGNKSRIEAYMDEMDEVFRYYESLINGNGLVGNSEYHMFIDWYEIRGGNSQANRDGNSAILTLNYAYSLNKASEMLEWLGYREKAGIYRTRSQKYAEIVRKLCFNEELGIYLDNPDVNFYDQRASILAVLNGAHSQQEKAELMNRILSPETPFDSYANLFYYFYLFEAMEMTGTGNFRKTLKPWKDIADMGMTATPEKRIEQNPRSEVHPWTAHPVHYYFSILAGIKPSSPGFETVMISPNPSGLKNIKAEMPTPQGWIKTRFDFTDKGGIRGSIILPGGMTGELIWNNKKLSLKPGENVVVEEYFSPPE